jgi:hypothetical protein
MGTTPQYFEQKKNFTVSAHICGFHTMGLGLRLNFNPTNQTKQSKSKRKRKINRKKKRERRTVPLEKQAHSAPRKIGAGWAGVYLRREIPT